jgi:type IV pilus assembly protein PilQ
MKISTLIRQFFLGQQRWGDALQRFIKQVKLQTHSKINTIRPLLRKLVMPSNSLKGLKNIFVPDDSVELQEKLTTIWFTVGYANASDLVKFISNPKLAVLSLMGRAGFDARTNQVWLRDDPLHLKRAQMLLKRLDAPAAQVLIKAKVINIDRHSVRSLGINMDAKASGENRFDSAGLMLSPVINLMGHARLNMRLNALEKKGLAGVVASPELIAVNGEAASIESGQEVPYQQITKSGGTSVTFKKAVLRLKVVPKIMPNQKVLLNLSVSQDKVSSLAVQGVPAIQTQRLQTQIILRNKETAVLGGIFEHKKSLQEGGVPVIGRLPILGRLFRHKHRAAEGRMLLIFVTPMIMTPA